MKTNAVLRKQTSRRARLGLNAFLETLELRRLLSTVTVTTADDVVAIDGKTSLREAVAQANAGDTINFAAALNGGNVALNSQLTLSKNVTIQGPGAGTLAIRGGGSDRLFFVNPAVSASIKSLTLSNGFADDNSLNYAAGGAVYNQGTLTLDSVTISSSTAHGLDSGLDAEGTVVFDPTAAQGGGIFNDGKLTLTNSTITNCTAHGGDGFAMYVDGTPMITGGERGQGGGIYNTSGGTITLTNTSLLNNQATGGDGAGLLDASDAADGEGGAIYSAGTILASGGQIGGNSATGGHGGSGDFVPGLGGSARGGAIMNVGAQLNLTNVKFSGNTAAGGHGGEFTARVQIGGLANGGAIYSSGFVTATACQFTNNIAVAVATGSALGGAIYSSHDLGLINCTVSGNKAAGGESNEYSDRAFTPDAGDALGGGIAAEGPGSLSINGSTISNNTATAGNAGPELQTDPQNLVPSVNGGKALGGGVFVGANLSASVLRSTLFGNSAHGGNGGAGFEGMDIGGAGGDAIGGAIATSGSGLAITHCTIAGNDTGGLYVGFTKAGEWLEYTVTVATAGTYNVDFRVASAASGGKFHLEADGVNATGVLSVPNTGGWQTWKSITKTGVNLSVGKHVLRLALDSNGATGSVGNFNYFKFTLASSSSATTIRSTTAAYVRNGSFANTNFGNTSDLVVKKDAAAAPGYSRESYIKFDLSSVASIGTAKLRLFGALDNATSPVKIDVLSSTSTSWSESTLTWNNKPTADVVRGSITVDGTTKKTYELDLTSFLKAEKAAGHTSVTLVLRGNTPTATPATFASDEAADGPALVITA